MLHGCPWRRDAENQLKAALYELTEQKYVWYFGVFMHLYVYNGCCTYIYIYIRVYVYNYMYTCTYMYIQMYVCSYTITYGDGSTGLEVLVIPPMTTAPHGVACGSH